MNNLSLFNKIQLLESKLGERSYSNMLPFSFDSTNINNVQDAGKKIANFIGLNRLTFIISYTTQKKQTAGHIQLDNSNDVFIEIDNEYKNKSEMVLSILAHEICHKYLQLNNVRLLPEYE